MTDILTALIKGVTAFTATNLDDIIILMLFFSQVGVVLRRRHVVVGQYLGFTALVLMSLPGFFGSLLFPRPWIGLLGILPIVIGLSQFFCSDEDGEDAPAVVEQTGSQSLTWFSPQATSVAAVTLANGGDNVGIYMPLFASADTLGIGIILTVFFSLLGVWCYGAYRLAKVEAIATLLNQYGSALVPFVLIGLGILILVDSHTLEYRGLTALALTIVGACIIHLLRAANPLSHPIPSVKKN